MCPINCPYLVLGGVGYICKKYNYGLAKIEGRPVKCRQCEEDG